MRLMMSFRSESARLTVYDTRANCGALFDTIDWNSTAYLDTVLFDKAGENGPVFDGGD